MTAPESLIRGWVYVISNQAMPGLVKVGFSTKDPHLRAQELGGSGNPHPFKVEYDCLVRSPRDIEQRIHEILATVREKKEWFRCPASVAINAIRHLVKDGILAESVPGVPTLQRNPPPSERSSASTSQLPHPESIDSLFIVGRLKPRGRGLWTLSEQSHILINRRSGRKFLPQDYDYDAAGQIKGFVLRDREIPWVNLSDVEFVN